jgi:hypothetical protein
MQPACPRCGGAGFYHSQAGKRKVDYARVSKLAVVNGLVPEVQKQALLLEASNLAHSAGLTFDNLQPEGRSGYQSNQICLKRLTRRPEILPKIPPGGL